MATDNLKKEIKEKINTIDLFDNPLFTPVFKINNTANQGDSKQVPFTMIPVGVCHTFKRFYLRVNVLNYNSFATKTFVIRFIFVA